jgi:hypothetical protein
MILAAEYIESYYIPSPLRTVDSRTSLAGWNRKWDDSESESSHSRIRISDPPFPVFFAGKRGVLLVREHVDASNNVPSRRQVPSGHDAERRSGRQEPYFYKELVKDLKFVDLEFNFFLLILGRASAARFRKVSLRPSVRTAFACQ